MRSNITYMQKTTEKSVVFWFQNSPTVVTPSKSEMKQEAGDAYYYEVTYFWAKLFLRLSNAPYSRFAGE